MGLFMAPFSGNAVGGGGHGLIDPPPPGVDPQSGPRSEVDTVNRSPLHLLRTTMNKHKPKIMKIVPPGQQRGALAPPYAWEPRERDDWKYALSQPKSGLKEAQGEFSTRVVPPRAPKPLEHPSGGFNTPRRGDTRRLKRPVDPRHTRVEQIRAELQKLHQEVRALMARQRDLVQQGKRQLTTQPASSTPQGSFKGTGSSDPGHWGPREALCRSELFLVEADYTPFGIQRGPGDDPHPSAEGTPELAKDEKGPDVLRREFFRERRARLNLPLGLSPKKEPPKQSAEIIQIHQRVAQAQARIHQLTQELQQLRQQMRTAKSESVGLGSNNIHRTVLLLK